MRRILQASAIMGLSSVATVALSAVRYKFVALHTGAEGIGVLGLLMVALTLATTLGGLGLSSSGVRYVAAAGEEGESAEAARAALLQGSLWLGLGSGFVLAALSPIVARLLLRDMSQTPLVLWLALALTASIVSAGHLALLNGAGQLAPLARANVAGAVVGTAATVIAVSVSGQAGLAAALAAAPLATWAAAQWSTRRLSRARLPAPRLWPQLRAMVRLGTAFAGSLLLGSAAQLGVRLLLQNALGLQAAGYYQAAYTIASVYLGFVLSAMAAEYYPRISALAQNTEWLNAQVNRQITVALLLAGPVVLWMIALAPYVVQLLYAGGFDRATSLLRWLLVGDVLKVPAWALGFLLLAREARWKFVAAEVSWNAVFGALALIAVPRVGLDGVGYGYLLAYGAYLWLVVWLAVRETSFQLIWETKIMLLLMFASALLGALLLRAGQSPLFAVLLAGGVTLVAIAKLLQVDGVVTQFRRRATK